MKEITIYTTPTCHFCKDVKALLTEKSFEYTEIDVAKDTEKRQEMIELSGQMGVPVVKIGNDVIIGFNKKRILESLEKTNEI